MDGHCCADSDGHEAASVGSKKPRRDRTLPPLLLPTTQGTIGPQRHEHVS
ncbi:MULTISPECIES: hypothetical protein [Cyanophyceae]|uniref:Uncharacterized protein n=1 Tax=Leptolyngbya subtilissima DQ-A4 TaxID=2933933 RepID=A0ABV0KBZ0_9CYAN|nr:hypothetical protein [Nodosilinea sp. FACHB-141]MBD2111736.1 hypothetical protein [Nodosilinea sp. FACHB-141]